MYLRVGDTSVGDLKVFRTLLMQLRGLNAVMDALVQSVVLPVETYHQINQTVSQKPPIHIETEPKETLYSHPDRYDPRGQQPGGSL